MAEKILLPSGLRIVVEPMPQLRSVSIGLWSAAGSAYESPRQAGMSHFLEHLLFKGTEKRTALEISATLEGVGGVLTAFTGREHTCYYTRSMDEHFSLSLELLADMYNASLLTQADMDRERDVIIEEINMYEDSPEDVAADLFLSTLWPGHPYGRAVSGTVESVRGVTRPDLTAYWRGAYVPQRTVLAVAGHIDPDRVCSLAGSLFPAREGQALPTLPTPTPASGSAAREKDIEQSHVCLGFPGFPLNDPDYEAGSVLCNILGGGACSRLFQEVREKRGLSYTSYCYLDGYRQGGYLMAYGATQPSRTKELIQVMTEQFRAVAEQGVTDEELQRSKDQLRGGLVLSRESSRAVMRRLGRSELSLGELYDVEERVARLAAVTQEDVRRVTRRLLAPGSMVLTQVSPDPVDVDVKELF